MRRIRRAFGKENLEKENFEEARKECRKRVIGKIDLRRRTRQGELENGSSRKRIGEGKSEKGNWETILHLPL